MTKIEWVRNSDGSLGKTWNPVVGCSIVSPGCTNCYAMRMASRLEAMARTQAGEREDSTQPLGPLAHYLYTTQPSKAGPVWTGKLALAPANILLEPLRRKKSTMWFVNSMSDLFHESVPDEWIDRVFAVMALCPQHTFQVLTKRSARMRAYLNWTRAKLGRQTELQAAVIDIARAGGLDIDGLEVAEARARVSGAGAVGSVLPNVWLGVSAERQKEYDERKDDLRNTPAAVHFFSFEPLLGPIVGDYFGEWSIVGGESGPGARPFDLEWARSIVAQCKTADVACFVKQLGSHPVDSARPCAPADHPLRLIGKSKKGGDQAEWPPELRVREMPGVASPAMETA